MLYSSVLDNLVIVFDEVLVVSSLLVLLLFPFCERKFWLPIAVALRAALSAIIIIFVAVRIGFGAPSIIAAVGVFMAMDAEMAVPAAITTFDVAGGIAAPFILLAILIVLVTLSSCCLGSSFGSFPFQFCLAVLLGQDEFFA